MTIKINSGMDKIWSIHIMENYTKMEEDKMWVMHQHGWLRYNIILDLSQKAEKRLDRYNIKKTSQNKRIFSGWFCVYTCQYNTK